MRSNLLDLQGEVLPTGLAFGKTCVMTLLRRRNRSLIPQRKKTHFFFLSFSSNKRFVPRYEKAAALKMKKLNMIW